MTIALDDNTPRKSYTVSQGATQTSFTVDFEFFDNADLNVYVDGTLKTLTADYTVSGGNGSTGTVTISVTGATGGSTVVITRDIDLKRTTDFPASGAFQVDSLNTELDKLIAIAADLDDKASRALQLTDFDTAVSLVLPDVDTRKGKTLAFNASTGAVESGPSISDVQTVSAAAADIASLADIEDGTTATDAISGLAAIKANVTTVAGISGNVTTVAGISSNVTSVAGNSSNINTVAGKTSEITSVAAVASLITSDFVSDLNTLAVTDVINDLNTLATSDIVSDLNTLATSDIVSDINTLATSDIVSDLNTLATSDFVSDLNTMATSDVVSDLNTLAAISSDITSLAGALEKTYTVTVVDPGSGNVFVLDGSNNPTISIFRGNTYIFDQSDSSNAGHPIAFKDSGGSAYTDGVTSSGTPGSSGAKTTFVVPSNAPSSLRYYCTVHGNSMGNTITVSDSNISLVAGSIANVNLTGGSITNVNTVAGGLTNINTVATNISGVNSFAERYRVGSSDPTSSLDEGDLFFNTTSNQYKFYDGSAWQAVNVSGLGNIVEDTTPQLGGDLDVQTNSIVSVSDRDINITPNGTGSVVLDGIKYPQSDGTTGQFLKTDGSGQLAFATVATDVVGDTSPQLGGDLDGNGNTIDLSANTSALGIPVGTTAQRPGGSANGDIRINTTIGTLEFYNNGNWSQTNYVPVVNSVTGSIIASVASDLTIAVTNATATMDVVYKEGGTTLATTSDVDFSSGSATTAVPAAVYGQTAGDTITVSVIDNLGVPSSNSVSKTVAAEATGGTITRSGGKTIHTFTSSGTFTIPSGSTFSCDILVVAGGGGGNPAGGGGGGGGAGGFRKFTSQSLAAGARTVTVGAGGASRTGSYVTATNKGSESKFDDGGGGELAATGGGGGKSDATSGAVNNGGSGGGGSGGHMTAGGTGNEGGYTPSEGNNGGNGSGSAYAGGGGGGAGAAGSNGAAPVGGAGGVGVSDSITGSAVFYAGGGGGGGINSGGTSSGGNGGGGSGSSVSGSGVSGSGTVNTGGGGGGGPGGGGSATSGAGGSGVVIISYAP